MVGVCIFMLNRSCRATGTNVTWRLGADQLELPKLLGDLISVLNVPHMGCRSFINFWLLFYNAPITVTGAKRNRDHWVWVNHMPEFWGQKYV